MRTVAILLALLSALAVVPPAANAANECSAPTATNATQSFCVSHTVTKPAGQVPDEPYWDTYYVWLGPGPCVGATFSSACRGTPVTDGSGVPLPTSGAVGAGVFGILWQETNGLDGLQRAPTSDNGPHAADKMVLV